MVDVSTVFNSTDILTRFNTLGWKTSQGDLLGAVATSGLPTSVIVAYLDALIAASPGGLNDQSVTGVTPAQGTAITNFLRLKGLIDF